MLLARISEGDKDAYEEFVHSYEASVLRYAEALTASRADAEEVFQESFLAVWRHSGGFRGGGTTARAWLFAIVRNAGHRIYRRRVGEPPGYTDIDTLSEVLGLGQEAGWGDTRALPEVENREWIDRAMQALAIPVRELLILSEVEGLSLQELAHTYELGIPAIKSRLHRARLHFAKALRKEAGL